MEAVPGSESSGTGEAEALADGEAFDELRDLDARGVVGRTAQSTEPWRSSSWCLWLLLVWL